MAKTKTTTKKDHKFSKGVTVVDTNGSMPSDYLLLKREITQVGLRGEEVLVARGFVVARQLDDRPIEYVGRTNCWQSLVGMASPMFDEATDAVERANYLHNSRMVSISQRDPVEIELKELMYPIAKELPDTVSARQVHLTMSHDEARTLHGLFVAARQENAELPNGRPVASKADTIRYLLNLL